MRTRVRVVLRVIVVALVLAIGWFGLITGLNATSVPKLSQNRIAHSGIELTTDHPDVAVDVEWTLNSIGQVHLSVGEFDPYVDNDGVSIPDEFGVMHDPPGSAVISIKLMCDSRLMTLPKVSKADGFASVVRGGTEGGCETHPFKGSNSKAGSTPAFQELKFKTDGAFAGELTAYPVEPWTVSGAGVRIARTPQVTIGPFNEGAGDAYPVSAKSTISMGVTSDDSETVDTFFPQQISNGSITYDSDQEYIGKDGLVELASLVYTSDAKELSLLSDSATYTLPSATVKWVEPAQQQQGQLLILFSGVALGIVAAFIVELLLIIARGPRDKPTSRPGNDRRVARVR
jgi:hypothetical protein